MCNLHTIFLLNIKFEYSERNGWNSGILQTSHKDINTNKLFYEGLVISNKKGKKFESWFRVYFLLFAVSNSTIPLFFLNLLTPQTLMWILTTLWSSVQILKYVYFLKSCYNLSIFSFFTLQSIFEFNCLLPKLPATQYL